MTLAARPAPDTPAGRGVRTGLVLLVALLLAGTLAIPPARAQVGSAMVAGASTLTQTACGFDSNATSTQYPNGQTFCLPFIPSATPFAINLQHIDAQDVGVYSISGNGGVVVSDGTTRTTIDSVGAATQSMTCAFCNPYSSSTGGGLQMIVFRQLDIASGNSEDSSNPGFVLKQSVASPGYQLQLSTNSGGSFGGTSASGTPMYTVVWGRLWFLSIASTCWFNWSGALGIFTGLSAGGYCVGMSAYAVQTFDDSPTPSASSNPVNLPGSTLTVNSQ